MAGIFRVPVRATVSRVTGEITAFQAITLGLNWQAGKSRRFGLMEWIASTPGSSPPMYPKAGVNHVAHIFGNNSLMFCAACKGFAVFRFIAPGREETMNVSGGRDAKPDNLACIIDAKDSK